MNTMTYSSVKYRADRFVVTDVECRVTGVGTLLNPLPTIENAVTPSRGTMLLTEKRRDDRV